MDRDWADGEKRTFGFFSRALSSLEGRVSSPVILSLLARTATPAYLPSSSHPDDLPMSAAVDQPAQLAPTESVDVPLTADVDHPAVGVDAPETDTATEDSVPAPEDGVTDVLTEVLKLKKAVEALPVANGAVEDNEVVEPAAASEPEVRLYSPHATPRHAMYASPCLVQVESVLVEDVAASESAPEVESDVVGTCALRMRTVWSAKSGTDASCFASRASDRA